MNFLRQTAIVFASAILMGLLLWGGVALFTEQDPHRRAVLEWFKDNLNDPGSLQIVEWGEPTGNITAGNVSFAVRYRAKNGMGALTLTESRFILKNGKVAHVTRSD